MKNKSLFRIVIGLTVLGFLIATLGGIKLIDEFPADGFACITQPCIMPKITIFEWITRLF